VYHVHRADCLRGSGQARMACTGRVSIGHLPPSLRSNASDARPRLRSGSPHAPPRVPAGLDRRLGRRPGMRVHGGCVAWCRAGQAEEGAGCRPGRVEARDMQARGKRHPWPSARVLRGPRVRAHRAPKRGRLPEVAERRRLCPSVSVRGSPVRGMRTTIVCRTGADS
jgi:hypothetical protein